jgi:PAS domain S-box-containing protein
VTEDGALVHAGFMLDLSARKEAETLARERQAMLAGVLDAARAVTLRCGVDYDWSVVFMADAIEQISGYPAGAFTGPAAHRFTVLMYPDDLAAAQARVETALASDTAWEIEYWLRCADGSERWIASRGTPVRDASGSSAHVDGILFDIHALKETELGLCNSETGL